MACNLAMANYQDNYTVAQLQSRLPTITSGPGTGTSGDLNYLIDRSTLYPV